MTYENINKKISIRIFLVFVGMVFLTGLNQTLYQQCQMEGQTKPIHEARQKLNPILFKTLTFGFLPMAIDWIFLLMIEDPENDRVAPGQHPDFYFDIDLATDLDPGFFEIYQAGAYLLSILRGDHLGAKTILNKGVSFFKSGMDKDPLFFTREFREKYWGQAWNLSVILAYVYLFQLDDMPRAAESFREAAQLPGGPAYLASLEAKLKQPDGQYVVGLRLLKFLISGASDAGVRRSLERKLLNLSISYFVFTQNQDFHAYLEKRGDRNHDWTGLWKQYQKAHLVSDMDPWGGQLSINEEGKIVTTTPHQSALGLD